MNNSKISTALIILLVVMNGVLLFTLQRKDKPNQTRENRPARMIIDELDFDREQEKTFLMLVHEHRAIVRPLNEQMQNTRRSYFATLKQEGKKNEITAEPIEINIQISQLHKEINAANYKHFQDIRRLCVPDQIPKYNKLLKKMARHIGGPPPPRNRPR
jgi:periplasmic protein CpxP/Spy